MKPALIASELRNHAPFTTFGTMTGVIIMAVFVQFQISKEVSSFLFWITHPLHIFLSALVTTAMYRLHGGGSFARTLIIGYFGAVGIATLSDCLIPYVGEWLLDLPHRGLHLGFIEKWWLVNPLALAGIAVGYFLPRTKITHAGHVLLSTWASLFHMVMALGTQIDVATWILSALFLFLAVWVPCCTSDIIFPLLWVKQTGDA
ncbi:MAG TPA: hypothetical protein PK914_07620 [Smithellaceae bacterium]|nr:hypothetical protein [Smithellaceae bacterium]HNT91310.1 hypothetical protein [Smithellaceae bacterium]HOZ61975.1 hypothetical protein [Smithellaceae bacterium]HPM69783.1 hypothetical protein [Smithellaceae bacterium]HPY35329.1 hypothetical protein [Smithellaceae bacterium]